MLLALTPKELVDIEGVNYRIDSEAKQFHLKPHMYANLQGKHTDLGLVIYNGTEYYASTYEPPAIHLD